jgi:hypothetical protein
MNGGDSARAGAVAELPEEMRPAFPAIRPVGEPARSVISITFRVWQGPSPRKPSVLCGPAGDLELRYADQGPLGDGVVSLSRRETMVP